MGKNGHWAKKSKIPFFSKEKNGRTQKIIKNGQKMGTLKKNVARRQNRFSNTTKWKECQMEPNPFFVLLVIRILSLM